MHQKNEVDQKRLRKSRNFVYIILDSLKGVVLMLRHCAALFFIINIAREKKWQEDSY